VKAFALTFMFVLGLVAGMTWVTNTVTFLLTVAIFTLLAVALTYEPSKRTEDYYAARYREDRERRMRAVHLSPGLTDPDRYAVFDDRKPE